MIYTCATGAETIRVINGNEQGTSLSKIQDIGEQEVLNLEENEVFLDSDTGDLFAYNSN
jgi:hypothetical protein